MGCTQPSGRMQTLLKDVEGAIWIKVSLSYLVLLKFSLQKTTFELRHERTLNIFQFKYY